MPSTSAPVRHTSREIAAALLHPAVIVGSLGYFVDIYDLILFAVLRGPSLKGLGYTGDQLLSVGTWLINWQMGGMLLGGLLWGLLGDRLGRLKVLFGSIILYSLANIANGLVHDLPAYTVCRFLAGLGLAGELGGCITLVAEVLPQALRGYGTMLVSAIGVLGAVVAGWVGAHYDWRIAYYIGGALGILLLFLRLCVHESGMFQQMNRKLRPPFASQLRLLLSPGRLGRYICCVVIGLPNWYVIGLVVLFSPEFARALGATEPLLAPMAVAFGYTGISLGGLASGALSQYLRSRKIVLLLFLLLTFVLTNIFFLLQGPSVTLLYLLIFFLGFADGYWAIFVTVAAEHFGTNMRATVATTVPNFSRGSVIPITMLFTWLKPHYGPLHSALALGWLVTLIALLGWLGLRETFSDNLDYVES
jgi:putative MFS transporter